MKEPCESEPARNGDEGGIRGVGPREGTQSSTSGPLKLDLGPVQLSDGNSCGVGMPSCWPHANEANGQLIRHLITDRLNYE